MAAFQNALRGTGMPNGEVFALASKKFFELESSFRVLNFETLKYHESLDNIN